MLSLNQNWFGTTRGRLGYAILDGVLVYATGGVAYSGFDLKSGNTTLTAATGGAPIFMRTYGASSPTAVGFVVGGGVELAISGNLSVQGEYIYQQYPGFTLPLPTIGFGTTTSGVGNFSTNAIGIHMLRFGVNQRFNDPQELLSNPLNSPMITGVLARPVVDWSGFYIGVNGGYGGGVLEPQLTQLNSGSFPGIGLGVPEAVYTQDLAAWRHGGFLAGGQIGYNHQFQNNFIVGVESD
ncbi:MAG TPA: outer membrane beta-barrel protein, partial [Methylocystis sp.]|nr:outer membrane beta-barrel protein [Methylocystis sp.]